MSKLPLIAAVLGVVWPLFVQQGPHFTLRNVSALKISLVSSDAIIKTHYRRAIEVSVDRPLGKRSCLSTSSYKTGGLAILEETLREPYCNDRNSWEIRVPYGTAVEISSGSGDVRMVELEGDITLHAASGTILAIGGTGDLSITTSTADITVEGFFGNLDISTRGGDINIRDADGGLEASSESGDITLSNVRGRVVASAVSGDRHRRYR